MAITSRPQDKFALLFTGPTIDRFVKDIEGVFQVLTEYYNYPASNITVVLGSTPTTPPSTPGATVVSVANPADLDFALAGFATAASGPATGLPGFSTSALLYFTGGGVVESGDSKLVLDGGPGTNNVDAAWLASRLGAISDCHVNLVMQQSFAGGFLSAMTASGLAQRSFTAACGATEDSYGNSTLGSFFTHGWVRGLKLETLPAGTPDAGQYADQLGAAGQATNRLISLGEAMEFGTQIHDALGFAGMSVPSHTASPGPQYLGEPEFLIRDGSPSWWESPDIYLTHPNHPWVGPGDLYITDPVGATAPFNNTINVDVRNVGTHPVRAYSLGIEEFGSGLVPPASQTTVCDQIPAATLLLPMVVADIGTPADLKDTYTLNEAFTVGTTHQCIKAEAKLLCADVDYAWSVTVNDFEGQRNTDEMTSVPPPPMPMPFPGIQGIKEHIYGVTNVFDRPHLFAIVFPQDYFEKVKGKVAIDWLLPGAGPNSDRAKLDVVTAPVPHIPLQLKAGEGRKLIVRTRILPDVALGDGLTLPFEIAVAGDWAADARATNLAMAAGFAAVGGFTITIKTGGATLKGRVVDADGKAVGGARVFLATANDLQGATTTAAKNGRYAFEGVNPDVYRLWAEGTDWHSAQTTAVLTTDRVEEVELALTEPTPVVGRPVKIVLDRIRILDDHDPCIKGKGELTFTAVLVPDNDPSRKVVTRLPAKGVYHVSGKPGANDIVLEATLFDGVVQNRALSISISGKEIDFFDPDDELNRYQRTFAGDPESWYGRYHPSDEYLDREDVGDWALWYRVERG